MFNIKKKLTNYESDSRTEGSNEIKREPQH